MVKVCKLPFGQKGAQSSARVDKLLHGAIKGTELKPPPKEKVVKSVETSQLLQFMEYRWVNQRTYL